MRQYTSRPNVWAFICVLLVLAAGSSTTSNVMHENLTIMADHFPIYIWKQLVAFDKVRRKLLNSYWGSMEILLAGQFLFCISQYLCHAPNNLLNKYLSLLYIETRML